MRCELPAVLPGLVAVPCPCLFFLFIVRGGPRGRGGVPVSQPRSTFRQKKRWDVRGVRTLTGRAPRQAGRWLSLPWWAQLRKSGRLASALPATYHRDMWHKPTRVLLRRPRSSGHWGGAPAGWRSGHRAPAASSRQSVCPAVFPTFRACKWAIFTLAERRLAMLSTHRA